MSRRAVPPARPARQSAQARGAAMLRAARTLFLEHGYQQTSINELIRASGGSKATLAALYGNKAGLFAAVIADYADALAREISAVEAGIEVSIGLSIVGEKVLRFYLRPDALQAYRGVIQAGPLEPIVARRFYDDGHRRIVAALAARLAVWQAHGSLAAGDPVVWADRFTHMLRHGLYEQRLLGALQTAPSSAIRAQVHATVKAFLDGHR